MLSFQNSNGLLLVASLNFFRFIFVLRINSSFTHSLQSFLVISQHMIFPPNCLCIPHSILHTFWTTCRLPNMSCYLPFLTPHPKSFWMLLLLPGAFLPPTHSCHFPPPTPNASILACHILQPSSTYPFHCSHTYTTWIRWPSPGLLQNPIHFFLTYGPCFIYVCLVLSKCLWNEWMSN